MDTTFRIYPIGIQNFEDLRNNNNVYVDKTELIYRLANTNKAYFWLVPVVSEKVCWYPLFMLISGEEGIVSRFGNGAFRERVECLSGVAPWFQYDKVHSTFRPFGTVESEPIRLGKLYGKEEVEGTPAERFRGVIRRAYEQTGKPVVVLIDEYDAPY